MTTYWEDYSLLDSGNHRKLERYGEYILIRPDTQALWKPNNVELWKTAHAEFAWKDGKGSWVTYSNIPESWEMSWGSYRFNIKTTSFKHTGIFPEQARNWEWLAERVGALREPAILNLFAYTGVSSMVATAHGARVTHLDASRQSIAWAKENAELSKISEDSTRYILDDALKFTRRELRRGVKYDGIVLDPPAFGRGPKGEVWHIEESLSMLMEVLRGLQKHEAGSFLLLNGYASGYSPLSFAQLVEGIFGIQPHGEYGELRIKEESSSRAISSGIYCRFIR